MIIQTLGLFPDLIDNYVKSGVVSRALIKGHVSIVNHQLRDWASGVHKSVDDTPYGGGDGMLLRVDVLAKAMKSIKANDSHVVYLSAQGTPFSHAKAVDLSQKKNILFVCGRYAGLDQRFINHFIHEEISIGDYVVSGGEVAAMVVIDSVLRLVPGVLNDVSSTQLDSFSVSGGLLESPQFTRPIDWQSQHVPEELSTGNHQKINEWKMHFELLVTLQKRPEIIARLNKFTEVRSSMTWLASRENYEQELQVCGLSFAILKLNYEKILKEKL
jgi:tRNA (guanine37-N1)-methyltransferase